MTISDWVEYVGPLYVDRVAMTWVSRGAVLAIFSEAMGLVPTFVVMRATWAGLVNPGQHQFKVTDKGVFRKNIVIHWRTLTWIGLLFVLTASSTLYGLFWPHHGTEEYAAYTYYTSLYSLILLGIGAAVCVERPRRRVAERFEARSELANIRLAGGHERAELLDISVGGLKLRSLSLANAGVGSTFQVAVAGLDSLQGEVVRLASLDTVGVRLHLDDNQRRLLIARVFSDRYLPLLEEWRMWPALKASFRNAFE